MSAPLGEFDPGLVVVDFNGLILHGFAAGSFVKVKYDEDRWMKKIGADGEGIRVKNRNRGGSIEVALQQQSAANDLLSAQVELDRVSGTGRGPLIVKDLSGTTLVHAPTAWIKTMPELDLAKEASDRIWVFDTHQLELIVGSN